MKRKIPEKNHRNISGHPTHFFFTDVYVGVKGYHLLEAPRTSPNDIVKQTNNKLLARAAVSILAFGCIYFPQKALNVRVNPLSHNALISRAAFCVG